MSGVRASVDVESDAVTVTLTAGDGARMSTVMDADACYQFATLLGLSAEVAEKMRDQGEAA